MSTGYTRVTVASDHRNVEMLLPSSREVAALIPDVLATMGGPLGSGSPQTLTLTPAAGPSLLPHQSLRTAGIRDGAVLALDRLDEAVPQPLVYDLAEETEHHHDEYSDVWRIEGARMLSVATFGVFLLAGLVLAEHTMQPETPAWWSLGLAGAALLALAIIPRQRLQFDAELVTVSAAAVGLSYSWGLPEVSWDAWLPAIWVALAFTAWHLSRRQWQVALHVVVTSAALTTLWWGGQLILGDHDRVTAVAGIGTAFLLGVVPRLALTLSGLTTLDDATAQGRRSTRREAAAAFRNAHLGLAGTVVLCAISLGAAIHGLITQGLTAWTLPLAIALIMLTALRARNMPLALEQVALLVAAAIGLVLLLRGLSEVIPTPLLVIGPLLLAALPLALRLVSIPEHTAAQLRLNARRLESLATLTLLPLLVGLFGIYSQLTGTFQD